MHACYNRTPTLIKYAPLCCQAKPNQNQAKGYPESVRMQNEVCASTIVTLSVYAQEPTESSSLPPNKVIVPIVPGDPIPIVTIGTTAASNTIQQNALFYLL